VPRLAGPKIRLCSQGSRQKRCRYIDTRIFPRHLINTSPFPKFLNMLKPFALCFCSCI
jgi:hypothetical protein